MLHFGIYHDCPYNAILYTSALYVNSKTSMLGRFTTFLTRVNLKFLAASGVPSGIYFSGISMIIMCFKHFHMVEILLMNVKLVSRVILPGWVTPFKFNWYNLYCVFLAPGSQFLILGFWLLVPGILFFVSYSHSWLLGFNFLFHTVHPLLSSYLIK